MRTFLIAICCGLTSVGAIAQDKTATDKSATSVTISPLLNSQPLPDLPQGLTSFGAAIAGDHLYVYGGNTGSAHDYWNETQSPALLSLDLKKPGKWEKVGEGPRLQGLALVSHAGKLYRLGGFAAKNAKGEKQDLWSTDEFARWNGEKQTWDALPALPEPRSSFDAAVVDGKVFVIGGWSLLGADQKNWLETAWSYDLTKPSAKWESMPTPTFTRRALGIAAMNGKFYALGGMRNAKDGPSTEVDIYDIASGKWTKGPNIPGDGMEGFGTSAAPLGKSLFATTMSGKVLKLNDAGDAWEQAGTLAHPRFFHRLLPVDGKRIVAVGGGNMSTGKVLSQEVIAIEK